jgi:hypothetical protein
LGQTNAGSIMLDLSSPTDIRIRKLGEVFNSQVAGANGIAFVADLAPLAKTILQQELQQGNIQDIMRLYVQIGNNGYQEYIHGTDYEYAFVNDALVLYTLDTGKMSTIQLGVAYDLRLDLVDAVYKFRSLNVESMTETQFKNSFLLDVRGEQSRNGGGGVPEIPASVALPLLAMLGGVMILLKKKFFDSTK